MTGPIDTVYPDGVPVQKGNVRANDRASIRRNIANADTVQSTDLTAQYAGIYVRSIQANFDLDTSDTTSPHNGTTVLVDYAGNRFKIVLALQPGNNLSDVTDPDTALDNLNGVSNDDAGKFPATATNDNAAAGKIGEYKESIVLEASPVSLTANIAKNAMSISLTPGDWDVSALLNFNGGTSRSYAVAGLSLVSGTLPAQYAALTLSATPVTRDSLAMPPDRFSVNATTTVYLVAQAGFASTMTVYGKLRARRMR